VLGQRLRELRTERREKLTETAARAGISPQYLSEVERGRKEPSSEMIAALAGAFGLSLIDVTILVTRDLLQYAQYPQYVRLQSQLAQSQPSRGGLGASGPVALLAVAA
jgi:transcriptional regulator with XRE-family HTH domain